MGKSKRAVRHFLSRAYVTIAPSAYLQRLLHEGGFSTILIPNALELDKYPFKVRESCRPRLLWVRSFDAIYNPVMAVDVLANVRSKYPEAFLCMVGPDKDGSQSAVEKRALELGISDAVRITGVLSKTEWIKLSTEYDVFINTTDVDNLPVSVIEAMALGLPVVSTNVGGIPFLIDDGVNGVLVRQGDASNMAERIMDIMENTSLAGNLSLNARKRSETFDWNNVKGLWIQLFEKCDGANAVQPV